MVKKNSKHSVVKNHHLEFEKVYQIISSLDPAIEEDIKSLPDALVLIYREWESFQKTLKSRRVDDQADYIKALERLCSVLIGCITILRKCREDALINNNWLDETSTNVEISFSDLNKKDRKKIKKITS